MPKERLSFRITSIPSIVDHVIIGHDVAVMVGITPDPLPLSGVDSVARRIHGKSQHLILLGVGRLML